MSPKEHVCMSTRNTPTDHDWRYPCRCTSMQRGMPPHVSFSAGAHLFLYNTDARDEKSLYQRTPPTSETYDRRADACDQRSLWFLKNLLEWGLLTDQSLPTACTHVTLHFAVSYFELLYEFRNWLKKMSNWKNKEEKF